MNSKKNINIFHKILADHVVSYYLRGKDRDLRRSTRQCEDTGKEYNTTVAVRRSKITYTVVQSAIEFIYQKNNFTRPKEL